MLADGAGAFSKHWRSYVDLKGSKSKFFCLVLSAEVTSHLGSTAVERPRLPNVSLGIRRLKNKVRVGPMIELIRPTGLSQLFCSEPYVMNC